VCYLIDGPPVPTYYRPIPQLPSPTPKDRISFLQSVRYSIVLPLLLFKSYFLYNSTLFHPCTRQVSLPRPMHLSVSSVSPSILPTLPHPICWVGSSASCSVDVLHLPSSSPTFSTARARTDSFTVPHVWSIIRGLEEERVYPHPPCLPRTTNNPPLERHISRDIRHMYAVSGSLAAPNFSAYVDVCAHRYHQYNRGPGLKISR
jgi:hypothetical protein